MMINWKEFLGWFAIILASWRAGCWIWDSAEVIAYEPHVHGRDAGSETALIERRLPNKTARGRTVAGSMVVLIGLAFLINNTPASWMTGIALGCWMVALAAVAFTDVLALALMDYHLGLVLAAGIIVRLAKHGQDWMGGIWEVLLYALGGLVLGLLLWGLGRCLGWRLKKEALGIGDPLLVGMMTVGIGPLSGIAVLFLAAVLGLIGHTVWHQKEGQEHIPFALYISVAGCLIAMAGLIFGPASAWLPVLWANG